MAIKRSREEMSATDFEISSIAMANYLILLSGGGAGQGSGQQEARAHTGRVFECKTCSRRFPSFQALGGHRASHKKPKPEATGDVISHDDEESKSSSGNLRSSSSNNSKKAKTHECTICGVEFAIGQALGGHMRRHRAALTGSALLPAAAAAAATAHHDDDLALSLGSGTRTKINGDQKKCLDLNLTPLENGLLDIGMLSPIFC